MDTKQEGGKEKKKAKLSKKERRGQPLLYFFSTPIQSEETNRLPSTCAIDNDILAVMASALFQVPCLVEITRRMNRRCNPRAWKPGMALSFDYWWTSVGLTVFLYLPPPPFPFLSHIVPKVQCLLHSTHISTMDDGRGGGGKNQHLTTGRIASG